MFSRISSIRSAPKRSIATRKYSSQTSGGLSFDLSEEQKAFRDLARSFAREKYS